MENKLRANELDNDTKAKVQIDNDTFVHLQLIVILRF